MPGPDAGWEQCDPTWLEELDRLASSRLPSPGGAAPDHSLAQPTPCEADVEVIRALAYELGQRLVTRTSLHWVQRHGGVDRGGFPALRYGTSEVVLYPQRILSAQLADRGRAPLNLERLVEHVCVYLTNLERYFPSHLDLAERKRGR